jgi:hypothetical protein
MARDVYWEERFEERASILLLAESESPVRTRAAGDERVGEISQENSWEKGDAALSDGVPGKTLPQEIHPATLVSGPSERSRE